MERVRRMVEKLRVSKDERLANIANQVTDEMIARYESDSESMNELKRQFEGRLNAELVEAEKKELLELASRAFEKGIRDARKKGNGNTEAQGQEEKRKAKRKAQRAARKIGRKKPKKDWGRALDVLKHEASKIFADFDPQRDTVEQIVVGLYEGE